MLEGSLLLGNERELYDCVRLLHGKLDESMTASINAQLEVPQYKLKNHHSNLGTLSLRKCWQNRRECAECLSFSQTETKTW